MVQLAPLRGVPSQNRPWQGACPKAPWLFNVTVAIPTIDNCENVSLIIDLYRASSEKPYFLVIDTGSTHEEHHQLELLRADDCEVFDIRGNGYQHPSDPVAIAMDLAFSRCPTNFLFATHNDVFPRRRDLLAYYLSIYKKGFEVVGYEMSPRSVPNWKGLPSHTATLYFMPAMDRIGAGWSLRRWNNLFGKLQRRDDAVAVGWPDTEVLLGQQIGQAGLKWFKIGGEVNHARHVDENIDHCRSLSSSQLYAPDYHAQAVQWCETARREGRERLAAWRQVVDWKPRR